MFESSNRAGTSVALAGTDVDDELTRTKIAAELRAVNLGNNVHLANFSRHHARTKATELTLDRMP